MPVRLARGPELVVGQTMNDADRAKIAGVYQNRLDPQLFPLNAFQSDPTIFYVNDTLQLAKLPFNQWQTYLFWAPLTKGTTLPETLPADLARSPFYRYRFTLTP